MTKRDMDAAIQPNAIPRSRKGNPSDNTTKSNAIPGSQKPTSPKGAMAAKAGAKTAKASRAPRVHAGSVTASPLDSLSTHGQELSSPAAKQGSAKQPIPDALPHDPSIKDGQNQDKVIQATQSTTATTRKLGHSRQHVRLTHTTSDFQDGHGQSDTMSHNMSHDIGENVGPLHDTRGQASVRLPHTVAGTSSQRMDRQPDRKSTAHWTFGDNSQRATGQPMTMSQSPIGNLSQASTAQGSRPDAKPKSAPDPNPPAVTQPIVDADVTSKKSARNTPTSKRKKKQTTDITTTSLSDTIVSPSAATEAPTNFSDSYIILGFYADMFTDAEKDRIATANRLRVLTDKREHGHGLSPLLPEITVVESILQQQMAIEHQLELTLKRAMKKHPLGPWAASIIGIGEKQLARFLGAIGDPADRPSVKQLNAYCGMDVRDGVAPHRKKGEKSNWKEEARSRLRLLAESCIKQDRSPYRPVYDAGRAKYADSVHAVECPQCGVCKNCGKPPGRPFAPCCENREPIHAPVGSVLRDGHKHARALRLVAKRILEDLYNEAVRVRNEAG